MKLPFSRKGSSDVHRGTLSLQLGNPQQAVADFSEVIRSWPHYAPAYLHRGMVQGLLGHLSAALADVEQAHRLKPDDPEIKRALAMVREAMRRQQS